MENNRKLGIVLVVLSLIIGGIFFYYISNLTQKSQDLGCFSNAGCSPIERGLSFSHIAVGIFSFIFALGFYLLFFTRERIIKQKEYDITKLNSEEKKMFLFIRENKEKGIYQSNIVEHFNFPKSKVSRILDKLERTGIIERRRRGMTNIIFLK
ncbi:MarR family transcriptional regulator [Candidatus Pacearchaeota archaeon]|nr:MarR family transcriptional regulator [Candidatus Pacearchaeota archaeon]MBI2056647.1 MarR family transcriptional regulator [Candidatus Pacearchaeota archaeon]